MSVWDDLEPNVETVLERFKNAETVLEKAITVDQLQLIAQLSASISLKRIADNFDLMVEMLAQDVDDGGLGGH